MKLKDNLNLYRRYPHWSRRKCIFVHIPKAAGTSINRAIFGRTLGHYRAEDIRKQFPQLFNRCFVFAFVRNPWDRVLSAYRFAIRGRTESMGMRNFSQYRIPEFASFERFLFEWLVKQDMHKTDFVFRPQHIFTEDAGGQRIVDFVGRVESISDDIAEVESRLGVALDVGHHNRTGTLASYHDAYMNRDMIDLVADIYSKDIGEFSYVF